MKRLVIAFGLLAGCSGQDAGNQSAGSAPQAGNTSAPAPQSRPGGMITGLTGLYESSGPGRTNQLCMVDPQGETARFGLVVWGGGDHSC